MTKKEESMKLTPIEPTKHRTPRAVAKALLKLYQDPRRHYTNMYYKGVSGRSVDNPERAVACCVIGGVGLYAIDEETANLTERRLDAAAKRLYSMTSISVNDCRGLDAVEKILREVAK